LEVKDASFVAKSVFQLEHRDYQNEKGQSEKEVPGVLVLLYLLLNVVYKAGHAGGIAK
jgi:hypothetical protein